MINVMTNFFQPMLNKKFWRALFKEISEDTVSNGAAALAFYSMLAIFPAVIFLFSILPYLPIDNLSGVLFSLVSDTLPKEAAEAVAATVMEVTTTKNQGLLSFGAIFTLWSASAGIYAVIQQLNITYDVEEARPFWKVRGISILLTLACGAFIVTSFALIVGGGVLQNWLDQTYILNPAVAFVFQIFRWAVVLTLLLASFAIVYYFGPDVDQEFKFVSPGSIIGVFVLILASLAFRLYVENFGNFSASYGSLGAVIVLMMWLYISGHVILLGSEINALIEHVNHDGKEKGEKVIGDGKVEARTEGPPPSSAGKPAGSKA